MESSILMEIELTYLFYFVLLLSFLVWNAGRRKKVKKKGPRKRLTIWTFPLWPVYRSSPLYWPVYIWSTRPLAPWGDQVNDRFAYTSKQKDHHGGDSGKHLFAGLEELKPDLILLDIMLEVLVRLICNPATGGFYLSYDVKHWAHTELLPAWEVFSHLIEINKIRPKLKELL